VGDLIRKIFTAIRERFFFNRKTAYLDIIKERKGPISGKLPKGMVLPSIPAKGNDYTFIDKMKNNFVSSGEAYTHGVSIVVPVYNRKTILSKTLAGIINQTYPAHLIEAIIADDGSSDGVEEIIPHYENFLNIKYVKQDDKGYRLSAVRNLGIKAATHDCIIILDCDMLPTPELVESYMQYLHVTSEAVLIGYRRFVCTDKLSAQEIREDINLALDLPDIIANNPIITKKGSMGPTKDWREKIYDQTNFLKDLDYPFRVFCGGNVAFHKSVISKTSYFDTSFQNWGGEDTEMGFRIYNSGYYFIPVKGATALHQEPIDGIGDVDREAGQAITHELLIDKCPAAHYRKYGKDKIYSVPKVSIYIPAYNASNYIEEAVNSALNQSYTDLEVVIVDDGSTDDTLKIIEEKYNSNSRVRWASQKNKGIGSASNKAVKLCKGQIIGQLDADDILKIDAVETLLPFFSNKEIGCVYGSYEIIDKKGNFVRKGWDRASFTREEMLCGMIVHPFRLFRKRDWWRTSGFDESLENAVDYDIYSKLSDVCDFHHVNKILYSYRHHGQNTSIEKKRAQDKNTIRVIINSLKRLSLHDMWEPFAPNSEKPKSVTFRPRGDFGGWSISKFLFDFINGLLEPGSRIIEMGSGWGTGELAKSFEMYSIEHNPHFLNIHYSNYINAPIVEYFDDNFPNDTGWYDADILKKELPRYYDLILVDGPLGIIGRSGFYRNLALFRSDVPIILDDVNRKDELTLLEKIETKTGRKAVIHKDPSLKDGKKTKHFAVLMPAERNDAENMKDVHYSIKSHPQKDEILKQITYGQDRQKTIRPFFKIVIDILNSNEISYSLGFGTLLGCIRHGFEIPWDDDYDIHILKKDTNQLLDLKLNRLNEKDMLFSDYMLQNPNKKILAAYTHSFDKKNAKYQIFFIETPWNFLQVFIVNTENKQRIKAMDIFHEEWRGTEWITEKRMFPLLSKQMSGMTLSVMKDWKNYLHKRYSSNWKNECVVSNHNVESVFIEKNEKHISFELIKEPRWRKWFSWKY